MLNSNLGRQNIFGRSYFFNKETELRQRNSELGKLRGSNPPQFCGTFQKTVFKFSDVGPEDKVVVNGDAVYSFFLFESQDLVSIRSFPFHFLKTIDLFLWSE